MFKVGDFILAGDVFDTWRVYPEVINFALTHLPFCWAVPGQHDLPHHRLPDIKRSAYWTLVEAGKIGDLSDGDCIGTRSSNNRLRLYGFPWGAEFQYSKYGSKDDVKLAVIHRYCWQTGHTHPGARQEDHVMHQMARLQELGYTAAVWGDNHSGFLYRHSFFNCGTPIRRRSDEWNYQPQVGVLWDDSRITPIPLDTSVDKMGPEPLLTDKQKDNEELTGLVQALKEGMSSLDFREAVEHYSRTTTLRPGTKHLIAKLLEES